MAEIKSSGSVKAPCQHLFELTCTLNVGETPSENTTLGLLGGFQCVTCGVSLYPLKNGKPTEGITVPLVTTAPEVKSKPKPQPSEKKPEMADGPGKELMLIFAGLGVPGCQSCTELANKMNEQGVEWCEANVDAVVADILPRAQEWLARPEGGWADKLKARAPQFAQAAVLKRYVGIALRNWRDKLELQTAGGD